MNAAPKWFKPVAIIALLWNLMGCMAYLSDVRMSPEDLARLSEAQQAMYASRPAWAVAATATAVWGGVLGCIGLLARKRWAFVILLLSLMGVIAQDVGLFAMSRAGAMPSALALALQCIVLVVAIDLVLIARKAVQRGWID